MFAKVIVGVILDVSIRNNNGTEQTMLVYNRGRYCGARQLVFPCVNIL